MTTHNSVPDLDRPIAAAGDPGAESGGPGPRTAVRCAGAAYLLGVVLYVLPSALHGNPPIDDAAATLDHVAGVAGWRIAHLANILAVLLWVIATALLSSHRAFSGPLSRAAVAVWAVAAGVFGVYFGIHAIGLPAAADQLHAPGADPAAVVSAPRRALVLGSTAFVAQAAAASPSSSPVRCWPVADARTAPTVGAVIGLGWTAGAVMLQFAVIVPFTTLAWVWFVVLGLLLCTGRRPPGGSREAEEDRGGAPPRFSEPGRGPRAGLRRATPTRQGGR